MKSLGFILPAFLVSLVFLGSDNPYLPPNHSDSASVLGVLALLLLVFNLQKLKSKTGEAVVLSPLILVLVYFLGWLALGYWYTVRLDLSYEWIVKSLFAVPLAGFLTHNLIDTFWGNGGLLFYFVLMVCLVDFLDRSRHRKIQPGLSHRPALAVGMTMVILFSSWMLVQYYHYETLVNREVFKQPGIEQAASVLYRSAALCARCSTPYLLMGNFYLMEHGRSPASGYLEKA